MLENLASKATAVFAVRRLLADNRIDPAGVDYILETSEEACGDMNQRGGGNFAKAIGERAGLSNATGADIRSFCAGPVHGLLAAAALVRSSVFRRVVVAAGGTTAKLAMNAKKHIEKGFPVLEDCLGSFAVLVEADAPRGLAIRTDAVGRHRIGSGSSPQAVIQDLVAEPLARAGLSFSDVDVYAPELQNPEITEAAGAGNVTLANLKMIAATAVVQKEISREEMPAFIAAHGVPGWAPTQGHIPSGVPALGWFLHWAAEGKLGRGLVIGKGSLFLGRMTNLFDGVSLLLESRGERAPAAPGVAARLEPVAAREAPGVPVPTGTLRIGLTLPGSEVVEEELRAGAAAASATDPSLEVVFFGEEHGDPSRAHREVEQALAGGAIHGAVTFHYPFPIGIATVGHTKAPGNGRDLFISSTTGAASADRVKALVLNAVSGVAAARACGVAEPRVGLLNLDGAASAMKKLRELAAGGWGVKLASSVRGDSLLRGNDILAGSVDVLVCDSLTGNAVVKLLAAFPSGGKTEVTGSGYGPAVGEGAPAVGIISRATSAQVAANALALMARALRGGLAGVFREEMRAAREAGLARVLARGAAADASGGAAPGPAAPAKKAVDHEIEGVDVLEIEAAVAALRAAGVYCEAGMGCTGPVVLVSRGDAAGAVEVLRRGRWL
jgi:betaine reductase